MARLNRGVASWETVESICKEALRVEGFGGIGGVFRESGSDGVLSWEELVSPGGWGVGELRRALGYKN